MGTVLLSVLSGHWRYAHINGVRGDGINPGLLGLRGTVSEDAVRLAMARIEEAAGLDWLSTHILGSISPALRLPWILDIDVTVKPLYGHQQGAEIGYNPQKPGRPSHVYHSYFVANLRICLSSHQISSNGLAWALGINPRNSDRSLHSSSHAKAASALASASRSRVSCFPHHSSM